MSVKKYYIKERSNPQFQRPYYIAEGQLSKAEAKRKEKSAYGSNAMIEYWTEEEYKDALNKLKLEGFNVY